MTKKLEMVFTNQMGSKTTLIVDNAKEDLTQENIKAAMNAIITANIFETTKGELTGIDSAQIVTTDIEEMIL
ncbi:DUF2922 domain-containing protein [Marinisporobacter balticus]|uniref:DUF2922 family protein n=1 Tax=Marinisporobacter balticus TaxID=2018667 RepID=A0A4V2S9V7_9FIRM|nr:DUF2922 domain-containing protein [Marinisporobacter balticus]TCO69230.1 DUF2922 family protein [Marinisporobacter balticus]